MPAISIFSPRSVSVMTVKRVASLPVPAVVGTAMTGNPAASACTGTLKSRICLPAPDARPAARIDMALAVSMGDPPPKPIRQSYDPDASSAAPASITTSVGSGTVSLNTAGVSPAASNGSRQRRTRPLLTM